MTLSLRPVLWLGAAVSLCWALIMAPARGAPPPAQAPSSGPAAPSPLRLTWPAAERIVAFGDLHGDLAALEKVLRVARLVDEKGAWSAGRTVVVQTGDLLDRGDDEPQLFERLASLAKQAQKAGGQVHVLNGNHEYMNAQGDFRYVTSEGLTDFGAPDTTYDARLLAVPTAARGRALAMLPGGSWATRMAEHPFTVTVGETAFVHGGLLPEHVRYGLSRMNEEARAWLLGLAPSAPAILVGSEGPIWSRLYSHDVTTRACQVLDEALRALPAKRMVVGHTIQEQGINAACDGKVWRIDVGMAKHYGGPIQALEIRGDQVTVLR